MLDALQALNWAMIVPVLVIQAILMIIALVDVIKVESTNGPKWIWILMIVLINIIGPVIYFIVGRKES